VGQSECEANGSLYAHLAGNWFPHSIDQARINYIKKLNHNVFSDFGLHFYFPGVETNVLYDDRLSVDKNSVGEVIQNIHYHGGKVDFMMSSFRIHEIEACDLAENSDAIGSWRAAPVVFVQELARVVWRASVQALARRLRIRSRDLRRAEKD
jgi:hypothetical protein